MTQQILQINFKFTSSANDYRKLVAPFADPIAAVPGLKWKVWLLNEKNSEAGGVYLFRDETSVNAYLNGEIVAGVQKQPKPQGGSAAGLVTVRGRKADTHAPARR